MNNDLIFYQILSTNSSRKCTEISLENFYVDIGNYRGREVRYFVIWARALGRVWSTSYQPILCQHVS